MLRRFIVTIVLVFVALTASAQQATQQKKTAVQKLAKLVQPWPEDSVLAEHKTDAERRALFQKNGAIGVHA